MSRHRTPGRRRAPGAVRRLPDGFSRLGATWAAKSVAAVGVLAGAAVALALPVDASPAALTLAVPAATSAAEPTTVVVRRIGEPVQVDSEALGLLTAAGLLPGQPARVRRDGTRVIACREGAEESSGVSLPDDIASHVFVQVS